MAGKLFPTTMGKVKVPKFLEDSPTKLSTTMGKVKVPKFLKDPPGPQIKKNNTISAFGIEH